MAENTKIEWATHTANFWEGCTKVSAGCKYCYAETRAHRWGLNVWGPTADRRLGVGIWRDVLKWEKEAAAAFAADPTTPRPRVFSLSLGDFFEGPETCQNANAYVTVSDARNRVLTETIPATPHLDWLLLTKRPENILRFVPDAWKRGFPRNVWIGTSVEDQATADQRIPHLLPIPAVVRFLSIEPLQGPVTLRSTPEGGLAETVRTWLAYNQRVMDDRYSTSTYSRIDWVIVGGESGPHARPMHPDWARGLRDQCVAASVPYFFKQWGEWMGYQHDQGAFWKSGSGEELDAAVFPDFSEHPQPAGWLSDYTEEVVYRRVGKHAAGRTLDGRTLDGRTWDEVPTP